MSVVLVYPPLADATQPYSSLPALAGFLRARGWSDVHLVDAALEYALDTLTPRGVERAAERIDARLREADRGPGPQGPLAAEYTALARAALKAPVVAEGVEEAVRRLRSADTYLDLEGFAATRRLFREALEVHGASVLPLGVRRYEQGYGAWRTPADVARWARDEDRNPYLPFLRERILPRVAAAGPLAVGISLTYRSQVVAAVTLALLLREAVPHTKVVLGGQLPTAWYPALEDLPEVLSWCDYLVAYEGETALHGLLSCLAEGGAPREVPNLAWREGGEVVRTPVGIEDVDALPTPDHEGLPLERYVAPEPVFLVTASRGCYWGRCAFCAVSPTMKLAHRRRDPDLVHGDLRALHERHGARCFSFTDDCVPPASLRALSERLLARGPAVSWQCEARLEKALSHTLLRDMARAGCRNLVFGLESTSQRVLDAMDKGTSASEGERILADCRELGIAVNLQLFFGFPGETAAEARRAEQAVLRHARGPVTASFDTFELQRGSAVASDPAAWGLSAEADPGSLTIGLPYSPVPPHARESVERLRQALLQRTAVPGTGLGMNAHTLVLLHRSGVQVMEALYGEPPDPGEHPVPEGVLDLPLRPRDDLSLRGFAHPPDGAAGGVGEADGRLLLYAHGPDRLIAVPRLAAWLLGHLDGTRTPVDLAAALADQVGASAPAEAAVRQLVTALVARGVLVV